VATDASTAPSTPEPRADRQLMLVWRSQRQWSLAADNARASLDRFRRWNLALLIIGALAGAFAAQTWLNAGVATVFAGVAAVALAIAGVIQANGLNANQTTRWTQARAASETLKAEIYRYLAGVAPYAGDDRAKTLSAQLAAVQTRVPASLLVAQQTKSDDTKSPPQIHGFQDYVTARAEQQARWHKTRSAEHNGQARQLRICQIVITGFGAVLSAVAGVQPSWQLSAWTAAVTTIAAAVGTHLAATQHQRIAAAYASTADQLERLIVSIDPTAATPDQQAQFVAQVERVLAGQNDGWTDLISQNPAASGEGQEPPKDADEG